MIIGCACRRGCKAKPCHDSLPAGEIGGNRGSYGQRQTAGNRLSLKPPSNSVFLEECNCLQKYTLRELGGSYNDMFLVDVKIIARFLFVLDFCPPILDWRVE